MSNAFQDPERPVICPYDKNHTVFASRYNTHIVKCRKNHPDSGIAVCDYNHDHRIPKLELKYHHEVCPDRIAQEARPKDLIEDENVMEFPIKNLAAPVDDVWEEEDLNHQGYDANDYAAQNNVLRLVSVEKPSVKKQFRKDEQKRMNIIRAPTASSSITTTNSHEWPSIRKPDMSEQKPIDEDKPELSLADRIQKGETTVYEPADSEEFQFPRKTNRKNRK